MNLNPFELWNDQAIFTPRKKSPIKEFVKNYSTVLRDLLKLGKYLQNRFLNTEYWWNVPTINRNAQEKRYGIYNDKSMWTIDQKFFEAYGRKGLARAQRHMDLLHQLLIRHDIGLSLAVYPWPDQIFHHDRDSRQVRFWQDWASRHSVQFINLFPEFIEDRQHPKQVIAKYFIEGDIHWNDQGHQLVGQRLLGELEGPLW